MGSDSDVLHDLPPAAPRTCSNDVEIAVRIAPDAVARFEHRVAPLREALALEREDADQARVVLDDVDDVLGVDVHHRRADQLRRPDLEELPLLVEDLDAVVLAVGDEHSSHAVYPDAVRQIELSRS